MSRPDVPSATVEGGRRRNGKGERAMVPEAEPRSYYDQPVIQEPVWTWEIPVYFFVGGAAGASAGLAYLAHLQGNRELSRRAWAIALGGISLSPMLLISDLGKPARFLNMLRMFKITSPMSVGSWVLAITGGAVTVSAAHAWTGLLPGLARGGRPLAALAGMPLATYTGALISNTAVPAWHSARHFLPFVFAGGAAASAGAAAVLATPAKHAEPARRLAVIGAALELGAAQTMEHATGIEGEPYKKGLPGALSKAATLSTAAGAGLLAKGGKRRGERTVAKIGAGLLLAGAFTERWAIFRAGFKSAAEPRYTVGPQRERVRKGESLGAARMPGNRPG
ncbi:MAG: NrfD/PsrC family molybdoenzyme membrane anchor subunit [Thermoleophilaceae bacterium]